MFREEHKETPNDQRRPLSPRGCARATASSVAEACSSDAGPPFNRSRVPATAPAAAREKMGSPSPPPEPSPHISSALELLYVDKLGPTGSRNLQFPRTTDLPHVRPAPPHTTSTASRHDCHFVLVCRSCSSSSISMESSDQRMASGRPAYNCNPSTTTSTLLASAGKDESHVSRKIRLL